MTYRWLPRIYTQPLSPTFISDGPKLRKFVELFCKTEDGKPLVLDPWQAWFIDACLERYPDDHHNVELAGRLRFREVVLSVARQNGKSEIATVLGFYGLLMHDPAPYVIGLASNKEQADLIYRRVQYTATHHGSLAKRFKSTGTRGIKRLDASGFYVTKPAKADALQGIPVSLCLFDEVHLCSPDMWSAMTLGTQAKSDGIVIGLTTAGDNTSTLLKTLYDQGQKSVNDEGTRIGFFCWTAPDGVPVDDPEGILDANPSVVCGRRSLDVLLDAVRRMPESDARRYVLNQFVSSDSNWLPAHMWHNAAYQGPVPEGDIYFTVDTAAMEWANVTVTIKYGDKFYTHLIWQKKSPRLNELVDVCVRLNKHYPKRFIMDSYHLNTLGKELERRGLPVRMVRGNEIQTACAVAYELIAGGQVTHADDRVLKEQMPVSIRTNRGDGWRITRQNTAVHIDAVMAMVLGIYGASIDQGDEMPFAAA